MAKYKQKCSRCKKNYVLATWRDKFLTCYECDKTEMDKPIKDPEMKKMFEIPEEYYVQNNFLRNIKVSYQRYGELSEKQIAAFKKVVDEME
jgi:ribosomal protein S27AE